VIIIKPTPSPMPKLKNNVKNWTKKLMSSNPLSLSQYIVVEAVELEVINSIVFNSY